MSVPNTSNDPQAPLLAGERAADSDGDDSLESAGKRITVFGRTFSIAHLVTIVVGILALIAIGISIAAIGTSSKAMLMLQCFPWSVVAMTMTLEVNIANIAQRMSASLPNACN
jgi:hypothetical protein